MNASVVPNDPSYGKQWGFKNISAPAAWDLYTGACVDRLPCTQLLGRPSPHLVMHVRILMDIASVQK